MTGLVSKKWPYVCEFVCASNIGLGSAELGCGGGMLTYEEPRCIGEACVLDTCASGGSEGDIDGSRCCGGGA